MTPNRPIGITLEQFTASFVPAGLLMMVALLWPELQRELDLGRTRYTIWVTTILLAPALILYPFRGVSQGTANMAHLAWTWAWTAFITHAYWATFLIFDGVMDTFRQMGALIAGINFILTGLWTVDLLLLWLVKSPGRLIVWLRLAVRVFTFLVFAVTLLFLREGAVWWLGAVFTFSVLAAIVVRLLVNSREPSAAAAV